MADSYTRKFAPNKFHIISAILTVISLFLLVSGAYRAFRVMGRLDPNEITSEFDVHENDSILLNCQPVRVRADEAVKDRFFSVGSRADTNEELFVVNAANCYRYAAVKMNTDEYERLMNGEEITGYFSRKYGGDFLKHISVMGKKLSDDTRIEAKECSDLGIIIVDREKELLSFLWFFPFLAVALVFLKIGGSPYFYFPEEQ